MAKGNMPLLTSAEGKTRREKEVEKETLARMRKLKSRERNLLNREMIPSAEVMVRGAQRDLRFCRESDLKGREQQLLVAAQGLAALRQYRIEIEKPDAEEE